MNTFLQIVLGGGIGAGARYLVGLAVPFPLGTLAVNVIGSALIGWLWATLGPKEHALLPFLTTGILGGFTTFSAFSLDTFRLVEKGQAGMAVAYVAASLILSLAACFAMIAWVRT
jgi:fluoride exporter